MGPVEVAQALAVDEVEALQLPHVGSLGDPAVPEQRTSNIRHVLQHYVEAVLCDVRFRQEELRWARHHDRPIARERRSRRPPDKTDKSPSSVSSVTGPPSGSDLLEPDQLDRGERGRGGLTEFLELPAHSPAWLVSVLDLAAIRTCATSARRTCSPTGEA